MKFNVDGAFSGSLGQVGIGGILRGSGRTIISKFYKSVGAGNSSFLELLAIQEAFLLFGNYMSNRNSSLWIESDSANVVFWSNKHEEAPWKYIQLIIRMERLQEK